MKVSIIIPTLNEEHHLPELIDCIHNEQLADFEVIVADAGSKDKTVDLAKAKGARVVAGGFPGIGRNSGAKVASGELLVFIDADVSFDKGFLKASLDEFTEQGFDLAIPRFNTHSDKLKYRILLRGGNTYKNIMSKTPFPDGTGQLVIVKRSVFEQLGGYVDWQVAEDSDLFWRAASKKHKIGVLSTQFHTSMRRYEKFGILWIFSIWGLIGLFMILGVYKFKYPRVYLEKLYGEWGKWGKSNSTSAKIG